MLGPKNNSKLIIDSQRTIRLTLKDINTRNIFHLQGFALVYQLKICTYLNF